MCIIADPPTFIPIFKETDPEYGKFSAVREWVKNGPGKFITGGTTYQKELMAVKSIIGLLSELEKRGKVMRNSAASVDHEEGVVKALEPAQDFDDPHLVALVRVSGCKLICIRDPRSHRFLRMAKFYKSTKDRPKLYTREKNRSLLCNANMAPCCK
jgi:hypothetical protein